MAKKFLDFGDDEPSYTIQTVDPNIDRVALKQYQNEVFTCLYHISTITNRQKEIKNNDEIEVNEKIRQLAEYDRLYYTQRKLFMDCLSRIKKIDPNDSFLRTVLEKHKIDLASLKGTEWLDPGIF